MRRQEQTTIRVRRTTVEALERYRATCLALAERGREVLPPGGKLGDETPTLDDTIIRLIDVVRRHNDRTDRQKARRRALRDERALQGAS
jgi:hypothetical protein